MSLRAEADIGAAAEGSLWEAAAGPRRSEQAVR